MGITANRTNFFSAIVDGGPGPSDAPQTIGVQPNGYAQFGGVSFYCVERHTLQPSEVTAWKAQLIGPGLAANSTKTSDVSTGTSAATRFLFQAITALEVATAAAENPALVL
jgi:hypothetical protein